MTPENFVYWLQGYFELNDAIVSMDPAKVEFIGPQQIKVIKDHLKLVLKKKTPSFPFIFQPSLTPGVRLDPDPAYYRNFISPVPPASC